MTRYFAIIVSIWLSAAGAAAGSQNPDTLTVGVKEAPPFVIRHDDGRWSGVSIELWRVVADELEVEYRFQPVELDEFMNALTDGDIDVAVGALSITREREKFVDFSHTYYVSSLGIAVPSGTGTGAVGALAGLFLAYFLKLIGGLAVLLLVFGALLWWFEREHNAEQFGQGGIAGIGSGVWWAAVTMTTVGYGDRYPKTLAGRVVALVWMFSSVVLVSLFTGAIASVLTVNELGYAVDGPEDLPRVRVASVGDSASGTWLEAKRIGFVSYPDVLSALEALSGGEADAVVYDRPILTYLAHQDGTGQVHVLPRKFALHHYGFALQPGSELRESINGAILTHVRRREWRDTVHEYTGSEL
jgi:ABC-type amino acid transport substrate-binding protein